MFLTKTIVLPFKISNCVNINWKCNAGLVILNLGLNFQHLQILICDDINEELARFNASTIVSDDINAILKLIGLVIYNGLVNLIFELNLECLKR
jgi:hypothetical protein